MKKTAITLIALSLLAGCSFGPAVKGSEESRMTQPPVGVDGSTSRPSGS